MSSGRTGGDQPEVRAARAVAYRDVARSDVADHHRNQEGGDPAGAALQQHLGLVAHGGEPADSAGDDDADAGGINFTLAQVPRQSGGGHRFVGSCDRILAEKIQPLRFLGIHVPAEIEVLDLSGDLGPVFRGIEPGDRSDAAASVDQGVPEIRNVVADAGNHAVTGNYNPSVVHIILASPSLSPRNQARRMFLTENRTTFAYSTKSGPFFGCSRTGLAHRPGLPAQEPCGQAGFTPGSCLRRI